MIIAYVCDRHYMPLLEKSIASVRRYNKKARIVVLSAEHFEMEGVEVYQIKPDTSKFKYRHNDRMKDGVYYKFWLPELPFNKVLYIDCDVMCQRPLNDLWKEKCSFICATESHRRGVKQARQLNLEKYALTGMMLCNLKAMRAANFTQRCLERLAKENPDQHDETIINLEFNDRIRFIDKKYNYCRNRIYRAPIPEGDAYLLHYVGEDNKEVMQKIDNFNSLGPLKTLLKGKCVAIVGNSSSLLTKGQSEEIDKHDIVIRFNKGFPSKKVGLKTDIVFLACTLNSEELSRFGKAYTVRRSKLCKNKCDFNISSIDRVILAQEPNREASKSGLSKSQASTGFIAINFALSADPKRIDLYGFDFFQNRTYYNPIWYQPLHNGNKEEEKILEYEKNCLLTIH